MLRWLFPELSGIQSISGRIQYCLQAYSEICLKSSYYWRMLLWITLLGVIAILSLPHLGIESKHRGFIRGILVIMGFCSPYTVSILFYQKIRLRLRCLLEREPYCLGCGYLLIGNNTGLCPECGTRISSQQMKSIYGNEGQPRMPCN